MKQLEQYLRITSADQGIWMGDGSAAYSDNASGAYQIWKCFPGGEPIQLTRFTSRAVPCYSPEGTGDLYFMMDTNGDEHTQIYFLADGAAEPRNLTNNPEARHEFGGILPGGRTMIYSSNARVHRSFDIHLMDLTSGEDRILLQNEDNFNIPFGLSPNGRYLLYQKHVHVDNTQLWIVDTVTGEAVRLLPEEVPEDGACGNYGRTAWKSDSSGFYLSCDVGTDFTYTAYYDLASRQLTTIYQPGWDVISLAVSPDNELLALCVREDGISKLVILRTEDLSRVNTIAPPDGFIRFRDGMLKNGKLLFSLSTATRPPAMWMLDIKADAMAKLTSSNLSGLDPADFCDCICQRYDSFDGLSVPYFLLKPKGAAYPLQTAVIYCHGGPEGAYNPYFNELHQYYLSQGIAIIAPNIRGSVGYGNAYEHLDDVEKRMDSVKDVGALVEHLVAKGVIRWGHVGIMGASYGGFMTLACIAEYPDMFAAAVDIVGISNLETFLENTSDYRRPHRESEYGSLAHHRELLRKFSPIHKADRIKAPLFVIAGATDPRVPISESDQMVAKLRAQNNIVEYSRYLDEGHGVRKLKNKLECYPKVVIFLKKYLLDQESES